MKTILIVLFSLIAAALFAQPRTGGAYYVGKKGVWPEEKPSPIAVDERYKEFDAVVLKEKVKIILERKYMSFSGDIIYSYLLNKHSYSWSVFEPVVHVYQRIHFLNKKGVEENSTLTLPRGFDPLGDKSSLHYRDINTIHRPIGDLNSLRYVNARLIKSDGRIVNVNPDVKVSVHIIRKGGFDKELYSWQFHFPGIEPGDDLELIYSYEKFYTFNPSNRIFFNGTLPIQDYTLDFNNPSTNTYMFIDRNGALAVDSGYAKIGMSEYRFRIYKAQNLDHSINEKGARIYESLPFITFYRHAKDFGEEGIISSYDKKIFHYPWYVRLLGFITYQPELIDEYLSKTSRDHTAIRKFINDVRSQTKDTSAAEVMTLAHQIINDQFGYDARKDAITGDDLRLNRISNVINKKTMEYQLRYDTYNLMCQYINRPYFISFVHDKRYERIHPELYENILACERYTVYQESNGFIFFLPKERQSGNEPNEFPFYYEDVETILIPQLMPFNEQFKTERIIPYVKLRTPGSDPKDNVRKTMSTASVSLSKSKIAFDTRLFLDGQYSTLLRGFYLYEDMDTTVNTDYYKPVYQLSAQSNLESKKLNSFNRSFPFSAAFSLKYEDVSVVKKQGNSFIIDLKNWFNFVFDDITNDPKRCLDFYPDFPGSDVFIYQIKFDEPVKLKAGVLKNVENSSGSVSFSVEQTDEQTVMVKSVYSIHKSKIPVSETENLKKIQLLLKEIMNSHLEFDLM